MSNPTINPNINVLSGQAESMAASGAMVVSGLKKELETNKTSVVVNDPKIDLKKLEDYIQKLNYSSPIEEIRKHEERKRKEQQKKEEKHASFKLTNFGIEAVEPFSWRKKTIYTGNPLNNAIASFQSQALQKALDFVFQTEISELIRTAKELKIDINNWNLEKFRINPNGEIVLSSDISNEEKQYILFREELKVLEIADNLSDDWVQILIIKIRKFYLMNALLALKVKQEEIDNVRLSAKQIAWLKLITRLKAMHLKRVFCGSQKDFNLYSEVIAYYTKKLRRIDLKITEAGINLIKEHLEKLALETAQYKLELLRSMQKLTFDKTRENDIEWLSKTAAHLKHL